MPPREPRIISAEEARALREGRESFGAWDAGAGNIYAGHDTCPRHKAPGDGGDLTARCECRAIGAVDRDGDRNLAAAAPDLAATVEHLHARLRPWQDAAADATTLRTRAEAERDAALTRLGAVRETVADWAHGEDCPAGDHGDCAPDEEGDEGCYQGLPPDECRVRMATCECGTAALRTLLRDEPAGDARTLGEARATAEKLRADVAFWRRFAAAAHKRSAEAAGLSADRDAALAQTEELTRALSSALLKGLELRAIIEGRTTPPTDAEIAAHDHAGGWWSYLPPPGQSSCTCAACATHQQPGGELPRSNVRVVASLGDGRWWALDAQRRPCAWPVVTEAPDAHR